MADLKNMNDKLNTIEGSIKNPPIDMISMDKRINNLEGKEVTFLLISSISNFEGTKVIRENIKDNTRIVGEMSVFRNSATTNLRPTSFDTKGKNVNILHSWGSSGDSIIRLYVENDVLKIHSTVTGKFGCVCVFDE